MNQGLRSPWPTEAQRPALTLASEPRRGAWRAAEETMPAHARSCYPNRRALRRGARGLPGPRWTRLRLQRPFRPRHLGHSLPSNSGCTRELAYPGRAGNALRRSSCRSKSSRTSSDRRGSLEDGCRTSGIGGPELITGDEARPPTGSELSLTEISAIVAWDYRLPAEFIASEVAKRWGAPAAVRWLRALVRKGPGGARAC